jgi:hypothetical protein
MSCCMGPTIKDQPVITSNYVPQPQANAVEQLLSITVEKTPNGTDGQNTENN